MHAYLSAIITLAQSGPSGGMGLQCLSCDAGRSVFIEGGDFAFSAAKRSSLAVGVERRHMRFAAFVTTVSISIDARPAPVAKRQAVEAWSGVRAFVRPHPYTGACIEAR